MGGSRSKAGPQKSNWSLKAAESQVPFLWTIRRIPHYASLGNNLIREIGSYLQTPLPCLPFIQPNSIGYFDFSTEQLGPSTSLQRTIHMDSGSTWTLLDTDRVVLCGGGYCEVWKSVYLLHREGEVQELPDMKVGHSYTGLAMWKGTVHVFGSSTSVYQSERTCERLALDSSAWEWLPDMHRDRCLFTPAVWKAAIYLCFSSIEVYDGLEMRELSVELPMDNNPTFSCVVDEDSLLVVTRYHMTVYCKESDSVRAVACKEHYPLACGGPGTNPTIYRHQLFHIAGKEILKYADLEKMFAAGS